MEACDKESEGRHGKSQKVYESGWRAALEWNLSWETDQESRDIIMKELELPMEVPE